MKLEYEQAPAFNVRSHFQLAPLHPGNYRMRVPDTGDGTITVSVGRCRLTVAKPVLRVPTRTISAPEIIKL